MQECFIIGNGFYMTMIFMASVQPIFMARETNGDGKQFRSPYNRPYRCSDRLQPSGS